MRRSQEFHTQHLPRLRIAAASLLIACSSCAPRVGRWEAADYQLDYQAPSQGRRVENVSERIYLFADNQRHELLGNAIFGYRTSISDKVKGVAIRPPQLDLFGPELLDEALRETDGFVLHLGDACDVSNTAEFAQFAWTMRQARGGWLMAPGNHDGYFMGNVSRVQKSWVREWDESAEKWQEDGTTIASRGMQKHEFLAYYLAAIILRDARASGTLARHFGPEATAIHRKWTSQGGSAGATFARYWQQLEALQAVIHRENLRTSGGPAHRLDFGKELAGHRGIALRSIAWEVDAKAPWKSYLTQEVDITVGKRGRSGPSRPVSLLLLDSAQYKYLPSMENAFLSGLASLTRTFDLQLAGTHGNILKSQAGSAAWMMERMRREGRLWIVASHHPYDDLGRNTPRRFDRIRAAGGVPLTLSAHTHTGEIRWNRDDRNEGAWLELNVGSMLDAPLEYRDFQLQRVGDRLAVTSHRFPVKDRLRRAGLLLPDSRRYRPGPDDPDYYLNYQRGRSFSDTEAEIAVKRLLLGAYLRMFRLFPSDGRRGSGTVWPVAADGRVLDSHARVVAEMERVATAGQGVDVAELTRLLYGLREYDRTRAIPASQRARLRAYRLSQAVWAGEVEEHDNHPEPYQHPVDPNISFLLLPARVDADPLAGQP